jgi:dienelactone hydrolase
MRTSRQLLAILCVIGVASLGQSAEPLPGTQPLTEEGDLAAKMVQGIHKYLDRELTASVPKRKPLWKPDYSSPEKYIQSIEPNRQRLRKYLGVVDRRLPPKLEYVGGPDEPALVGETDRYRVYAVRWAVLPGIDGEGLLLEPKGEVLANVIAVPDAAHIPEQIAGLAPGVAKEAQFARRVAEVGCRVLVPVLIDRKDDLSANPRLNRATNLPHREFVHRMAYEMGRTLLGYEIQKVLAAVDWFQGRLTKDGNGAPVPVRIIGQGDGGRVAFYAAALDDRIGICSVNGAFGPQENLADRPIDRNVWGLLTEFGDAEVAAGFWPPQGRFVDHLLWYRWLQIEDNATPEWAGPATRPSRGGAAPGSIVQQSPEVVKREFERIVALTGKEGDPLPLFSSARLDGRPPPDVPLSVLNFMNQAPVVLKAEPEDQPPAKDLRKNFDPAARHKRQFDQLVAFTQKLWRDSDAVRKEFWKKADASSPEAWEKSCEAYRDYFHTEVIGKLPEPTMPLNPRTRQVYDEKTWTGYEVMLDVYPDVYAYGILLLPKDLKPGEKRPVVVCQHGLEGRPTDTISMEKRPTYNHFSRRLVELGYIVYAPQNPYIGSTTFRQIQRKAQPLKASLFSFIVRQHQRTLDWLETLPNVDPKRIAFYGLSYGGKTAMRVPAIEKRYCLSICSADFNEWVGKCVSVDLDRSYMWTIEYDMYEFDLGHTFNYAEMAYLIAPRPFMVERGHDDGVGTDEMVAYEYAKVRYLYANRLKLPDRTEIEFFPGGHEIRAKGTFEFLKKHLGYPK